MKLADVIALLEKTITKKEEVATLLLASADAVQKISGKFVEINVAELKTILADLKGVDSI